MMSDSDPRQVETPNVRYWVSLIACLCRGQVCHELWANYWSKIPGGSKYL